MGKEIDEKKLQEAKEKLACRIEPAAYGDGTVSADPVSRTSDQTDGFQKPAQPDFIGPDGRVFLTSMTTAGG